MTRKNGSWWLRLAVTVAALALAIPGTASAAMSPALSVDQAPGQTADTAAQPHSTMAACAGVSSAPRRSGATITFRSETGFCPGVFVRVQSFLFQFSNGAWRKIRTGPLVDGYQGAGSQGSAGSCLHGGVQRFQTRGEHSTSTPGDFSRSSSNVVSLRCP